MTKSEEFAALDGAIKRLRSVKTDWYRQKESAYGSRPAVTSAEFNKAMRDVLTALDFGDEPDPPSVGYVANSLVTLASAKRDRLALAIARGES